jgi:hypothetical protein
MDVVSIGDVSDFADFCIQRGTYQGQHLSYVRKPLRMLKTVLGKKSRSSMDILLYLVYPKNAGLTQNIAVPAT